MNTHDDTGTTGEPRVVPAVHGAALIEPDPQEEIALASDLRVRHSRGSETTQRNFLRLLIKG